MSVEAWPSLADYRALAPHSSRQIGGLRPSGVDSEEQPLVTIITVVRNGERFLAETMRSVAAQAYGNLEYIVVDGASTDRTLDIVRSSEAVVTRWLSEPDNGIYDAMNKGIALATGRYIKLLNADDLLPSDSVARAIAALRDLPRESYVRGDMRVISFEGVELGVADGRSLSRYFPVVLHPTWYVPRGVYERHGLYRSDLRVSADYEYALRLAARGVMCRHLASPPLATFRTDGASRGFVGVHETFSINRDYQGTARAAYVFGLHAFVKARTRALERLFGRKRSLALRRWAQRVRAVFASRA